VIHQPQLRCVEFVEQVTEWMDGALGDDDRVLVEEHMVICPHCYEFTQQMRTTVDALRDIDRTAPVRAPEAAREALLEMFRRERHRKNGAT
jgi:predicted anti-sigma-YlaC factor YlaD